jgi:hypothetical protein
MQHATARSLMEDFAMATGLTDTSREPRRYLWTDAFAVCNYLQLYHQSGENNFLQLALNLVDQVHYTLGKYRKDSPHHGWLSGLDEEQARRHPTIAGLRIGKHLPERQPDEAFDERLEWDRDGQYFHYLTKWMHALDRVSQVTGNSIYNQWALELAKTAYAAFSYTPSWGGSKRMYWKMSIDLTRPLVDSMGQHDPLDGLITSLQLEATAKSFTESPAALNIDEQIKELTAMCAGVNWATDDPLGIGGLFTDAHTLVQLIAEHRLQETARLESLLQDIGPGLQAYVTENQLQMPAEYRLAFRELGLSIGLQTISRMLQIIEQHAEHFANADRLTSTLNNLHRFYQLNELIQSFWLDAKHQGVSSWLQHADINNVMLATSLAPDGFLQSCCLP